MVRKFLNKKKRERESAKCTSFLKSRFLEILSTNLCRKALLTLACSSMPILLREGNKSRLILVSPKGSPSYQSFSDQYPGKLKITYDEPPVFSRIYDFCEDLLWAFTAREQAFWIRFVLISLFSPTFKLAILLALSSVRAWSKEVVCLYCKMQIPFSFYADYNVNIWLKKLLTKTCFNFLFLFLAD